MDGTRLLRPTSPTKTVCCCIRARSRERLIKGLPLVLNEDANWNHKTKQTKEGYLENYMAKNLYMLDAHLESRFETEPADGSGSPRMYLVPEGFWPLSGHTTYDDRYFWQAP